MHVAQIGQAERTTEQPLASGGAEQVSAANQAGNLYIQQERVESENDRAAANTMAKLATDAARENVKAQMDGTRLAIEAARVLQQRQGPIQGGGGE
jgi:predicted exporter